MKVNILIVDDEEEIREMLSRHFRFSGYEVQTAENGKAALNVMKDWRTDIVISDIRMPVMDGPELCSHIRDEYPSTRVIMMTGYVTMENALACMRRGADTCLFKPFEDLNELENAVADSVARIQRWHQIFSELRNLGDNEKPSPDLQDS